MTNISDNNNDNKIIIKLVLQNLYFTWKKTWQNLITLGYKTQILSYIYFLCSIPVWNELGRFEIWDGQKKPKIIFKVWWKLVMFLLLLCSLSVCRVDVWNLCLMKEEHLQRVTKFGLIRSWQFYPWCL